MARLRVSRSGRAGVVLEAVHAVRRATFRRQMAGGDPATLDAADAAGIALTPEEERWVRDLLADRIGGRGCLVELVERRFGPVPLRSEESAPLRPLPPA